MATRYVDFIEDAGALRLTLTDAGRTTIADIAASARRYGWDHAFGELIEWNLCNSDWEWLAPWDVAALTSAPILSRTVERNDAGDVSAVGRLYWFEPYQVTDLLAELAAGRPVIFTGVDGGAQ